MRGQWSWLLGAMVVVAATTLPAGAAITNVIAADDGDGAVVCVSYPWQATDEGGQISVYGDQYWGPGHILGDVFTDTELDPTLKIITSIDNDTTFAWTGYQVNFTMNKAFTLSSVSGPAGWAVSYPTGSITSGPAAIVFTMPVGGTPIAIGDAIDFSFKATFVGAASYCQELIPTPEPATVSLLAIGAMTALVRRRRR